MVTKSNIWVCIKTTGHVVERKDRSNVLQVLELPIFLNEQNDN